MGKLEVVSVPFSIPTVSEGPSRKTADVADLSTKPITSSKLSCDRCTEENRDRAIEMSGAGDILKEAYKQVGKMPGIAATIVGSALIGAGIASLPAAGAVAGTEIGFAIAGPPGAFLGALGGELAGTVAAGAATAVLVATMGVDAYNELKASLALFQQFQSMTTCEEGEKPRNEQKLKPASTIYTKAVVHFLKALALGGMTFKGLNGLIEALEGPPKTPRLTESPADPEPKLLTESPERQSLAERGLLEQPTDAKPNVLPRGETPIELPEAGKGGHAARIAGAVREQRVADLVGGKVSGEKIKTTQGSTDVDVVGPKGELIAVGGPAKAKSLGNVGRSLMVMKEIATQRGVPAQAYFTRDTPPSVVDLAERKLGSDNVFLFDE